MRTDVVVLIPARLESVRLPEKLLLDQTGLPLVVHTYLRAASLGYPTYIVTDNLRIAAACRRHACAVVLNPPFPKRGEHESGSARLAATVLTRPEWERVKWVVNWQGDEPRLEPEVAKRAIETALRHPDVDAVTVACPFREEDSLADPDLVKVVADDCGRALYFSRLPLRGAWRHVGLYVFSRGGLRAVSRRPQTPLAVAEKLEQLNLLERGGRIRVVTWPRPLAQGVDNREQYQAFADFLQSGSAAGDGESVGSDHDDRRLADQSRQLCRR